MCKPPLVVSSSERLAGEPRYPALFLASRKVINFPLPRAPLARVDRLYHASLRLHGFSSHSPVAKAAYVTRYPFSTLAGLSLLSVSMRRCTFLGSLDAMPSYQVSFAARHAASQSLTLSNTSGTLTFSRAFTTLACTSLTLPSPRRDSLAPRSHSKAPRSLSDLHASRSGFQYQLQLELLSVGSLQRSGSRTSIPIMYFSLSCLWLNRKKKLL